VLFRSDSSDKKNQIQLNTVELDKGILTSLEDTSVP